MNQIWALKEMLIKGWVRGF